MFTFQRISSMICLVTVTCTLFPPAIPASAESLVALPTFNSQLDFVSAPSGFGSGKVWSVWPSRQFKKPSDVVSLVQNGDTVEIDAATYTCDTSVTWSKNFLTLRGVGGRPILDATNCPISGGKGIWNPIFSVNSMIVDNIEFIGAVVGDQNCAGIRYDGFGYLYITRSSFHGNQNGVLLTPGSAADIVIDQSEFYSNWAGDGRSHNMYIAGNVSSFVLRFSYSHDSIVWHLVKSRAQNNLIVYNRLADEAVWNSSYNIDIPNGWKTYIIGNIIQQSTRSENQALLSYSAEGGWNTDQSVYIAYNTFVNERAGSVLLNLYDNGLSEAKLIGNLISGILDTSIVGVTPGKLVQQGNLLVSSDSFTNAWIRDYSLKATSPAINIWIDPGSAKGVSLDPQFEYLTGSGMTTRILTGSGRDIGALEYKWGTTPPPPTPINWVCGSASGSTFDTAPTQNLCSVWAPTALTGTGPWLWSCLGQNGGTNMACSANKTTVIVPPPSPSRSCTIQANPLSVINGQPSVLNWTMTNALTGTLSPGMTILSGATGSISVIPPAFASTNYSLTLSGWTGSVVCSVIVSATGATTPPPPSPPTTWPGWPSPSPSPVLTYTPPNPPPQLYNPNPPSPSLENRRKAPQATLTDLLNNTIGVPHESPEYRLIILRSATELWRYTLDSSDPEDVRTRLQAELRSRQRIALNTTERVAYEDTERSYMTLAWIIVNSHTTETNTLKAQASLISKVEDFMYVQAENTLNLRSGMSLSKNILTYIKRNQKVSVIQEYGGWSKIAYGSLIGYVKSAFLRTRNTADAVREGELSYEALPMAHARVKHSGFIRKSPQLVASIQWVLFSEDVVYILDTLPGWYEIIWWENRSGFIRQELIELDQ